jgi:hypothetical protein
LLVKIIREQAGKFVFSGLFHFGRDVALRRPVGAARQPYHDFKRLFPFGGGIMFPP